MMAEQRTESGGGQGLSALPAFQADEHERGVGERPFQTQIGGERVDQFLRERQEALLVALAKDSYLRTGQLNIFQLESTNFNRTQTVKQHQTHHRQIAKGVEASPELFYLLAGERKDDELGLLQTQSRDHGAAGP